MTIRVGHGYDLHRLRGADASSVRLGGVNVPANYRLVAHSDGDVVVHALCDALLGAAALGDIGQHFSDKDPRWAGVDSMILLAQVVNMVRECGFVVANCDITVLAEAPKIAPHAPQMRERLAQALGIETQQVSIKAKTMEGLGSIGARHAIAAHAIALIERTE